MGHIISLCIYNEQVYDIDKVKMRAVYDDELEQIIDFFSEPCQPYYSQQVIYMLKRYNRFPHHLYKGKGKGRYDQLLKMTIFLPDALLYVSNVCPNHEYYAPKSQLYKYNIEQKLNR